MSRNPRPSGSFTKYGPTNSVSSSKENKILEVILGNRNIDELKRMRLVCKKWNNVISERLLRHRVQIKLRDFYQPCSHINPRVGILPHPDLYAVLDNLNEDDSVSSIIQDLAVEVGFDLCRGVRHFLKYARDRKIQNMPKLTKLCLWGNAKRTMSLICQIPRTVVPPISSIYIYSDCGPLLRPGTLAALLSKLANTLECLDIHNYSPIDFTEQGVPFPHLPNVKSLEILTNAAVGADFWLQCIPNLRRLVLREHTWVNLTQLWDMEPGQLMAFPSVEAVFLGRVVRKGQPCYIAGSTKLAVQSLFTQFPNAKTWGLERERMFRDYFLEVYLLDSSQEGNDKRVIEDLSCSSPDAFPRVLLPGLKRLNIATRDYYTTGDLKYGNVKDLQINNLPNLESIVFEWDPNLRRRLNRDVKRFARKFRHLRRIVLTNFCSRPRKVQEQLLRLLPEKVQCGCFNHGCRNGSFRSWELF